MPLWYGVENFCYDNIDDNNLFLELSSLDRFVNERPSYLSLQAFIESRERRWKAGQAIPSNYGTKYIHTCKDFDTYLESMEGVAQFVGLASAWRASNWPQDLRKKYLISYLKPTIEYKSGLYYKNGLAQLLIIKKLLGKGFIDWTNAYENTKLPVPLSRSIEELKEQEFEEMQNDDLVYSQEHEARQRI